MHDIDYFVKQNIAVNRQNRLIAHPYFEDANLVVILNISLLSLKFDFL